jgi:hypothetical protein
LDVAEGRIYISRDVVFDETDYPFIKLNPNAGARLRSEILLLPQQLKSPPTGQGDEFIDNSNIDVHLIHASTNGSCSSEHVAKNSGENGAGNRLESSLEDGVYVLDSSSHEQPLDTDHEEDVVRGTNFSADCFGHNLILSGTVLEWETSPVRNVESSFVSSGSPTVAGGSSAPSGSSASGSGLRYFVVTNDPQWPTTRLQKGTSKPKIYIDGTMRYGLLTTSSEPQDHHEALADPKWKKVMDSEFEALLRNDTWHLIEPKKEQM